MDINNVLPNVTDELDEAALASFQALLEGKETMAEMAGFSETEVEEIYALGYDAWQQGKLDEAAEMFSFAALLQPLDPRFTFAFGCAIQQRGDHLQALALFMQAVQIKPTNPFISFHMAECLLALQERDAAADALQTVIKLCYAQVNDDPRYQPLREQAEVMLANIND